MKFAAWQDPELALRLVTELPRSVQGDAQVQELARCLFNGGNRLYRFDSLYEQAPERLRLSLVEVAFRSLNGENLDNPNRWIDKLALLPEASRAKGIESIARAWAQQSPEEAIAWTRALAAGESRNGASSAIAAAWAARDVSGASAWVASMDPGTERDCSAGSLVTAMAERYPQQAWTWALSIQDPAERTRAVTQAAQMAAVRDLAMARQWIETGPFTPELKAELQSAVERSNRPPGRR